MQMMFHKQHFGCLAIGFSNVDEIHARRIERMSEEDPCERFYRVTSGGVHHPWEHKEDEVRVAITGDGMDFDPDRWGMGEEKVRIFAKVEFSIKGEVYLAYRHPHQVITWGFEDPLKSAAQILELAMDRVNGVQKEREECRWVVVDKKQVHKYHRSLLGKVMNRVKDAFTQGHHFFQDMKAQ